MILVKGVHEGTKAPEKVRGPLYDCDNLPLESVKLRVLDWKGGDRRSASMHMEKVKFLDSKCLRRL